MKYYTSSSYCFVSTSYRALEMENWSAKWEADILYKNLSIRLKAKRTYGNDKLTYS